MNFNPKISIIIPVYNGSNYMREAIDSVISQTYDNFEVIVVNDGSMDEGKTREIALSYGEKIRYFEKENGGVATALNLGIEKMTGEYFSWLSHDDMYYPNKLEEQVKLLETLYDKNSIIYTDFECIDKDSQYISTNKVNIPPVKHSIFAVIYYYLHGCSLLIPKECFLKVGVFDPNLRISQDYDLWLKFAHFYKFVHLPKVLIKYRIHSEQLSRQFLTQRKEDIKHFTKVLTQVDNRIIKETSGNRFIFYITIFFGLLRKAIQKILKKFNEK